MIFFCYAFDFDTGCSDNLPSILSKNRDCKIFKLNCAKLKNKCGSKLETAFRNSKSSKICKKALKGNAQKRVNEFCRKTCRTCGKFCYDNYLKNVKEVLLNSSRHLL